MSITENFRCLTGCGIKSSPPMFRTEILIYQSRSNFDLKILFGKVTHLLEPEIREKLVKFFY